MSNVISTISTHKHVRKGCDSYLSYMFDSRVSELKLESVPVVCEYPNLFPEELPGLQPRGRVCY